MHAMQFIPWKSQWCVLRLSSSGLFLRLYRIMLLFVEYIISLDLRLVFLLQFELGSILSRLSSTLLRFIMFGLCKSSTLCFDVWTRSEFDKIWTSWLFWWLYGGGGVVRICESWKNWLSRFNFTSFYWAIASEEIFLV